MRGTAALLSVTGDHWKPLRRAWRFAAASAAVAALVAVLAPGAASLPSVSLTAKDKDVGNAAVVPLGTKQLGPAPRAAVLHLDVVLSPRDPKALSAFASAVSTPGNSLYGHYLRTGEFPAVFGPTPGTIARVLAGLHGTGLRTGPISANHLIIPVSTTVGTAERAFGVVIESFRLASGRLAIANLTAPRLPATIARSITAVVGLDDLTLSQPANLGVLPAVTEAATTPASAATTSADASISSSQGSRATGPQACGAAASAGSNFGAWTENQLAKAYSSPTLYARGDLGAGVTIALFEATAYDAGDVATFQKCYGTDTSITNVKVNGGTTSTAGLGEAELDIETVLGIAPKAKLLVYEVANSGVGTLDEYDAIVSQNTAEVISSSWGQCEVFLGSSAASAENTIFEQAAAQGQSMLAVPGDEGSEGCLPNDFGAGGVSTGSGSGPDAVAVDPATHTAYVTDFGDGDVSVVNEESETVVKTVSLGSGTDPYDVAVDPVHDEVFVTAAGAGALGVIDGATCNASKQSNCSVGAINLEGAGDGNSAPEGVAVDPTTKTVYVVLHNYGQIAVISESSDTLLGAVGAGGIAADPDGITIDVATNQIYFAVTTLGELGDLPGATCDVANTSDCEAFAARAGNDPTNVTVDAAGNTVYVANSAFNTVTVLNATTGTTIASIGTEAAGAPGGMAISPSGTALLVACASAGPSGAAGVVVISLSTDKVTSVINGGSEPFDVASDPNLDLIDIADFKDNAMVEQPIVLDPWDPATQPFVTGVGGTDLTALGPKPTQSVWDEPLVAGSEHPAGAGGGGISVLWGMPKYQAGPGVKNADSSGVPCGDASGDCREVPDVSASADPVHGYVVFEQGQWESIGGTSAATPLWAAIIGLLDVQQATLHRVGFLNPALYKLVAAGKPIVNDITKGNDDYTTTGGGLYPATAGYDMASGLGSPIGTGLSQYLGFEPAPTIKSLSPASGPGTGGTSVRITGTGMLWASAVKFGGKAAKSLEIVSPTEVIAVSPAGSGTVTVTVTTPGGTSKAVAGAKFTY
ncbi:MAG: protease pro-enzyme activation domain-containing protein [Acidimicrobiales bacterium]